MKEKRILDFLPLLGVLAGASCAPSPSPLHVPGPTTSHPDHGAPAPAITVRAPPTDGGPGDAAATLDAAASPALAARDAG